MFLLDSRLSLKNNNHMKIKAYGKTDVGRKRQINQDSILVNARHNIYAVADGMGGHKGGEVASAMAVETLQEVLSQGDNNISPETRLELAYKLANDRIYETSHKAANKDLEGMGTTLVTFYAAQHKIFISNVGDSRAYLFRDGLIWQITEDHSLVQEQIRAGLINPENSEEMVGKNVITRSVGYDQVVKADVMFRTYTKGDIYLLCSDGLTGMVPNPEIANILAKNPLEKVSQICIDEANKAGGTDNISCLIISLN
jgi:PPM family protein phosphatase